MSGGALLAFACDHRGIVTQVLRDDQGLLEGPGAPFLAAVAPHAAPRAFELLRAATAHAAIFDWALPLRHGDAEQTWSFAAAATADGLYVIATRDLQTPDVLTELMGIHNIHVNALREALAERARQRSIDALLDEMTELNNELTSTQRELTKKNHQLAQLDQQKNELLGAVAHDLRNPAGIVLGYAQVLQDLVPEGSAERQMVDAISRSAAFMERLLDDLLDLAVIESGRLHLEPEQVDLAALVGHVAGLFQIVGARKRVAVRAPPMPPLPPMHVDPVKLEQVLSNLLSNAIKFSEPGTTVRLLVHARPDEVAIEVHDQGPGIPETQRERLFEPFQRGDARATNGERSTGLGLAIARRIVRGHGGRVEVESEVGRGSCFRVVLPLPPRPAAVPQG